MNKLYCRLHQNLTKMVLPLMPWRKPELMKGTGVLKSLGTVISSNGVKSVLIVTDKGISKLGLMNNLISGLDKNDIKHTIYDGTVPNPTTENIEEALNCYLEGNCEAIIAFGGGSPMDCAKGVGARVARPDKNLSQLKGNAKVRKRMPLFFAVPTTAGSGSEATIAAVITDNRNHTKYVMSDWALIPDYAVLDPEVTLKLPPHITSTTGMDALTHAVEAYIGNSNTPETKEMARKAVKLIFNNLLDTYHDGSNIEARKNMQLAAYYAGIAFTRAFVGYVHAIAHTLGGTYNTPHGLANAVVLPQVLDAYGDAAVPKLAELADAAEITEVTDTMEEKARKFIKAIRDFNLSMDIPKHIEGLKYKDLDRMVERADREANPAYPVPKLMTKVELKQIFKSVMMSA